MDVSELDRLEQAIRRATSGVAVLTGAGVSIASGIPSFRGSSGLWERFDPERYATLAALREDPHRAWKFFHELDRTLRAATPNAAHIAIADLERLGYVSAVVTQNVDGLHQSAGNSRVIELHGTGQSASCLECGARSTEADRQRAPEQAVPTCRVCGGVMRPDVTLFGEPLPENAFRRAEHLVRSAGLLLVVGTSASVEPAARLPRIASQLRIPVWEINPRPALPGHRAVTALAEDALPALVRRLRPRSPWADLLRLRRRRPPHRRR